MCIVIPHKATGKKKKGSFFLTREFSRTLFSKIEAHIAVLLEERAHLCCRACGFNLTEEDLKAAAALPSAPGNFEPILLNKNKKFITTTKKILYLFLVSTGQEPQTTRKTFF